MMPRLVLFDIDGTILSPNGLGRASLDRALEERYGRAELSAGVSFGGRLDPDIVLPAPVGPTTAMVCPGSAVRLTPRRTGSAGL